MAVGLSAAEQTFTGTGHLMATAKGQQSFPNVDVGNAVGSANYAPGVAKFQGKDGQAMTFGTVSNPDLARMQAEQATAALRNLGIAQTQPQAAHRASSIEQAAGGLRASITAAAASAPSSSHVEAARNAPSGKSGQSR